MAEPLRLVAQAKATLARVNDYACIMVKRERLDGRLSPNHVVVMRVKERPFSVHLHWREPRDLAGQEVCYVEGRNNGEMRVHPTGLLSALGWVSLSPDDARTRKSSRHRITESGLANLVERLARGWELENKLGQTQVRIGTYEFNKARCTRVETIHANAAGGQLRHYRDVVYFDNQTHLPVRVECYDWSNQLEEVYSYINLRFNVGLRDADFVR
jgi:hypothetical protein